MSLEGHKPAVATVGWMGGKCIPKAGLPLIACTWEQPCMHAAVMTNTATISWQHASFLEFHFTRFPQEYRSILMYQQLPKFSFPCWFLCWQQTGQKWESHHLAQADKIFILSYSQLLNQASHLQRGDSYPYKFLILYSIIVSTGES